MESLHKDFINCVAKAMHLARSTPCPYCGKFYLKSSDYNHMICTSCKGNFYYICGVGIEKSNEIYDFNHFSIHTNPTTDEERVRIAG